MKFNVLLAAMVIAGYLFPDLGLALKPYRKWLIVAVMFLMSVTLPGERLRGAAGNARGLALCGVVSYVLVPLICGAAGWFLYRDEPGLWAGMAVLGALPCTLASATVWTRMAGGDDALALVYTVLSNVASVAVAPLILFLFLSQAFEIPVADMFLGLCVVVLIPVAVGQASRRFLAERADRMKKPVSIVARGLVLCIVLLAVSSMADKIREWPGVVAGLIGLGAAIHLVALAAAALLGRWARLERPVRIGVLFAGSQKTLFIGVYLAAEYFPDEPFALLPITAYHVIQLVIDTVLAGRLAARSPAA